MSKQQEIVQKENVVQAVLIADDFSDAFIPLSNDLPLVKNFLSTAAFNQPLINIIFPGPISISESTTSILHPRISIPRRCRGNFSIFMHAFRPNQKVYQ